MIISRSVSRNSRTRFRFVFEENTSRSFQKGGIRHDTRVCAERRDDVRTSARTSMMLGWCSSRRYLTSRTADMSRPSLNWPTLIFLMAILRPVASSRPRRREKGTRGGGGGCIINIVGVRTRQPHRKGRTPIDDCIRSFSHFLVLHPWRDSRVNRGGVFTLWGRGERDTYHLFCRSALALSTASMKRVINRLEGYHGTGG
jgi:hypothetical protein